MSAEARVIAATILLAGLLTGLAWWLAQDRPRVEARHAADADAPARWLVWAAPARDAPRDAAPSRDAPPETDAGAAPSIEDRLSALLVARICARRAECHCGPYPSPSASPEELARATTCEADAMRDFRRWWAQEVRGPLVLVDDALLEEAVDASVGCSGTRQRLEMFATSDAIEGEPCTTDHCRDGSWCIGGLCAFPRRAGQSCAQEWVEGDPETQIPCEDDLVCVDGRCAPRPGLGQPCDLECASDLLCHEGRCVPYAGLGDSCGDDGRPCDAVLRCVRDRCQPHPGIGERCSRYEPSCQYDLACVDGRCRARGVEGASCGAENDASCQDGLQCLDGLCARRLPDDEIVRCARGTLARPLPGTRWSDERYECIPVETACRYSSDCGSGFCEGAGELRCEPPGPHAEPPPEVRRSRAPICRPGQSCTAYAPYCECAVGSSCRGGGCRPHAQRGESCEHADCAPGLACDVYVPSGGLCVGWLCRQTTFFRID